MDEPTGRIELIRDRYEPIAVLGRGGQGEVLLALDHQHDHRVAIKVRDVPTPQDREEILSEARLLLSVRPHPNITLARDDFFVDDRYYLVMDWVEGRSLADELAANGSPGLPIDDVVTWLGEVASALDHLHAHEPPVLHLDVKPANILLAPDGRVVLVDFGIAQTSGLSYTGTRGYRAPELARGELPSRAADIYSLAATAFALLTGAAPEPGLAPNWAGVLEVNGARAVEGIGQALASQPQQRPRSATALVEAMRMPIAPHNVPTPTSSFVGREHPLAELSEILTSTRLLTLTGAGGCGKTRLAIELARASLGRYPEGVWLTELASLADPELVPNAVARAVGVTDEPGRTVVETLTDALRDGKRMLLLDNCEHLLDACAELIEVLLQSCPELTVVATSREPLRAEGEALWAVEPLAVPDMRETSSDVIVANESVRLFCQRAASSHHGFELDDVNATSVVNICRSVEGIPLAIELAAAQLRTATILEIAESLTSSIDVLQGGRRTVPRQETIRATIDWSYDRLTEDARRLFRYLSVFAGGFTSATAQEVAADDAAQALLGVLVECSVVIREEQGSARYRLLEPIRRYAAEQLAEAGEADTAAAAHTQTYMHLLEAAEPELRGANLSEWLQRLDVEHDNIRAALARALDTESVDEALRLSAYASKFWAIRGHASEGRLWLSRALAVAGATRQRRSQALVALGALALAQGDLPLSRASFEEALALLRLEGDGTSRAVVLNNLGAVSGQLGDSTAARDYLDEALGLWRALGEERYVAHALVNLGAVVMSTGEFRAARRYLEEAAEAVGRIGDLHAKSRVLNNLANIARLEGKLDEARESLEESLALKRDLGDQPGLFAAINNLAHVARAQGDLYLAQQQHRDALELAVELESPQFIADALEGLAIASSSTDAVRTALLFGAADALRSELEAPVLPADQDDLDAAIAVARRSLGKAAYELEYKTGAELEREAVVQLALEPARKPEGRS